MQQLDLNRTTRRGGPRAAKNLPELALLEFADPGKDCVLRIADLTAILRLRRASIYALLKRDAFPKPIKLTNVQRGWLASDIRQWLRQRQMERDIDAL